MCRNIKMLFNFEPPATDDEVRAAALQFVRKIAGTRKPSRDNAGAFDIAVEEIFAASKKLLDGMVPARRKNKRPVGMSTERQISRGAQGPPPPAELMRLR
jgi:hypothetical protein